MWLAREKVELQSHGDIATGCDSRSHSNYIGIPLMAIMPGLRLPPDMRNHIIDLLILSITQRSDGQKGVVAD
jgi:hypothetical protein